jgi:catechol 2,3-dioxygenase
VERRVIGTVRLDVADLDRAREFYERVIGLRTRDSSSDLVRLASDGGDSAVIELAGRPGAPRRPPGTTGLFHLAILVPSRAALAGAVRRLARNGWRLSGASDHLVSEAVYLSDVEGNGIEIYRDRPREQWPYVDGQLQMDTLPLDLEGLLGEVRDDDEAGMPAGTRIGHVHLNVADLASAERFYAGVLGFEVTVRTYPGALFLSNGGYHHHIGLNTWAGEGAPSPPEGALGLSWFELAFPGASAVREVAARLRAAGVDVEEGEGGVHTSDPSGNGILLRTSD